VFSSCAHEEVVPVSSIHPLLAAIGAARVDLAGVRDAQPVFVPTRAKAELLRQLVALRGQVDELLLRALAGADDLAESAGARDVGAWLSASLPVDRRTAHADVKLAQAVDQAYPGVAAAMAAGEMSLEQARVIVGALDGVGEVLDAAGLVEAERFLVGEAKTHDPVALRRLGRHLAAVVDPDAAEAAEAKALLAEEQHAQAATRLSLKPLGDGTTRLSGLIPDASAHRLRTYLEALTQPRIAALDADGQRMRQDHLDGLALCDLLERIDPTTLPAHGGDATTVVVTISEESLRERLAAAGLLDGDRISASEARRLACGAKIVPVVLGGRGEILDLGRGQRLFTPAQRKAIRLRDQRCRAEGCQAPSTWTDIHHKQAWADGGPTDLDNGISLCGHHHRRIHDTRYDHTELASGDIRFHRRT